MDFEDRLIEVFSEKTNCEIQHHKCPCNTCFHNIKNVDFQHVCWLILLGLRGDYEADDIIPRIRKEMKLKGN